MDPSIYGMFDIWNLHIPVPVALAAVALIGYLFGHRTRSHIKVDVENARRELKRARLVAKELEQIAETVRRDLATHRSSVSKFKDRVTTLAGQQNDASWQDLCKEAEEMLKPTLKLATQISLAYDEIRQQTAQLMTFTEVRTDPLTGVSNRRALDETLDNMFAMMARYENPFSIAIFDIDHFKQINDTQGHLHGDRTLQQFATALDESVRETDMVARYGGEEFVIIMPQTPLTGAAIFAERLRRMIEETLPITISGGLSEASQSDTPQSLLSRADSALYSAKAAGRNLVFKHDGSEIEPVEPEQDREVTSVVATAETSESEAVETLENSEETL
jgi:diguanylate cyclase (GGDEF)-like protein